MMKQKTDNIKKIKTKKDTPFSRFIDKWIYVILAFLCSAVLMLLVYYCYDIIPFGGRTVLRMDLFHQYGPLFAELYDRLTQFKSVLYSWNTGGGGAFLGNYYNYLSSPVGNLIALIAGHDNIPEAIGVMVLVKNALAASALAIYLKQKFGKNDFSISAFGLMYAFCGYFIAYYWNIMWIDAMYLLPLAVLGIEKIINERKCKLYVGTLAFSFFANYYMSFMICVFAIFFFLVHFISTSTFKQTYPDMPVYIDGESNKKATRLNKLLYNKFLRSGFLFAASSVLGVALVAFAVIPTYLCLKECSATSGSFPSDPSLYNSVFDFLANHLASLEPTIRSSGDTVLPNVYCGVLTVMLVPLYIFCNKISAKERGAHIVFLALFFVGFNLNFANYILHAFHFPNDLPFRFSFIYSFLLVTMGYRVLMHIRDIPAKAVLTSSVGVIFFIILAEKLKNDNITDYTIYISIGFIALYTIVLTLMRKKEYAQSAVALLLMCSVFAEVAIADIDHFEITQEKVNFVNGYNEFRTLKKTLDEKEGNDMYRLEKTTINTLMDASWFDYNGISVFSSMAYEKSANLQEQLGLDSNYINSYIYYPQTPVYNALMSLKYVVKNDENSKLNTQLYKFVGSCGKYSAYENLYYLPIGFCVDERIMSLDINVDNPFELQNEFWYNATGMQGVLDKVEPSDYEAENIENSENFLTESFSCYKENTDGDATLKINFPVTEDRNLYLYFDSYDLKYIDVYSADGNFSEHQSINESYILDCGLRKKGDTVTVEITLDGENDSCTADCYMYSLDKEMLDIGYEIVKNRVMDVDVFDETHIAGKVTVPEGKMLYTSINYDDGWRVLVDGKPARTAKIGDALLGVYIDEGEHSIDFKYTPKGLIVGTIISAAAVLFVIIILIYGALSKKKSPKPTKEKAPKVPKAPKISAHEENSTPTGIDAMMAEDLGENATVEDAEALIAERDEYEDQLERHAEGLLKADEIINTQKLDLKSILESAENGDITEE